jgi:protein TonB
MFFVAVTPALLPSHSPDALPPGTRHAVLLGAALVHVGAVWALLQPEPVRRAVGELLPITVDWIAPPAPAELPPPPPKAMPKVQPKPVIVSEPVPAPAEPVFVAPPPPLPVEPTPVVPEPVVAAPAPPPPPPAPPAPRTIAITAVEYLSPPVLTYPGASRRLQEQGQVNVRVLVDARGLPQQMYVIRSSGFARLDEAALATVRATRFKPYTEDGTPLPFWVVMPLVFELDN